MKSTLTLSFGEGSNTTGTSGVVMGEGGAEEGSGFALVNSTFMLLISEAFDEFALTDKLLCFFRLRFRPGNDVTLIYVSIKISISVILPNDPRFRHGNQI
jgi:hypothetical protein